MCEDFGTNAMGAIIAQSTKTILVPVPAPRKALAHWSLLVCFFMRGTPGVFTLHDG